MPRGRPRLTEHDLRERVASYCSRYGVRPDPQNGLPPFPSGQRESQQHRDWIAVYKANDRLRRRQRGQCERCAQPAAEGSILCEAHRGGAQTASLETTCPVCGQALSAAPGSNALHPACTELARLARPLGAEGLARLASYLWPAAPRLDGARRRH